MAAEQCSAPERVRLEPHNNNGGSGTDSASDHDDGSDDDVNNGNNNNNNNNKRIRIVDGVVNDELKQEFPTEEGQSSNGDWSKIWGNKNLLKEILEYLKPKDVILKLFSNSKYFKNTKNIIKYISDYRIRYGYKSLRPNDFFKYGKSNITCTLQAKNYLIARFNVAMNEQVQVYLHEQKLPKDSDKNTYYLTLQVVNKFESEWKIKKNSNKPFVDLEDLLPAMIPSLIKVKLIRKLNKNETLRARIVVLCCVIMTFLI